MFPIYIVSGLLSLAMVVHCIKTGRNTIWVYVLIMLMLSIPFVGALLYAGVEILPELLRSRGSRRAFRGLKSTLDPEGELRRAENATASNAEPNKKMVAGSGSAVGPWVTSRFVERALDGPAALRPAYSVLAGAL